MYIVLWDPYAFTYEMSLAAHSSPVTNLMPNFNHSPETM